MWNLKIIFAIFFTVWLSFSTCISTTRSMFLPAIVDENTSQLVEVEISVVPGKGDVYISAVEDIGHLTRESLNTAAEVAFEILEREKDCDIIFKIKTPVGRVEGPSGGAGFTILILSALQRKTIIDGFSITGTINRDGKIGYVGRIPSKYEVFAKSGGKLFVVSILDYNDKMQLLILKKIYGVNFYESDNIIESYEIATGKKPTFNYSIPAEKEVTFPPAKYSPSSFRKINEKMLKDAREKIKYVDKNLAEHFNSRIKNSENAFKTNNYYTSSNLLFLTLIDMEFSTFEQNKFEIEKSNLKKCWENYEKILEKTRKNIDNFEIISSSEVRYAWSKLRSNSSVEKTLDRENVANNLYDFYNIITSKYWCYAAIDFIQIANSSDSPNGIIDEYVKDFALRKYEEAKEYGGDDFQLQASEKLINDGRYIASLFPSSMVISEWKANNLEEDFGLENFTFTWPQLYYSHALVYKEVYNDTQVYKRLYYLAIELEDSLNEVKKIIEEAKETAETEEEPEYSEIIETAEEETEVEEEVGEVEELRKVSIFYPEEVKYKYISILTIFATILLILYIVTFMRMKEKK